MDKSDTNCPVCKGNSTEYFFTKNKYDIFKCSKCTYQFVYPIPTLEQLTNIYNEGLTSGDNHTISYEKYLNTKNRLTYEFEKVIFILKKMYLKGKLLDVGCAAGFLLNYTKKEGFETYGVELSKDLSAYGRNVLGLDIKTGSITDADYKNNEFNVVTLIGVIEHLPDANKIIDEIARVLKPGGVFIVLTENVESIIAKSLKSKWNGYMPPEHLCYYSPQSISHITSLRGFSFTEYFPIVSELRASYGGLLTNKSLKNKWKNKLDQATVADENTNIPFSIKGFNFLNRLYMKVGIADRMICVFTKK